MAAFDGERGEFRFAFGDGDGGAIERARDATATKPATAAAVPAEEIDARDVERRVNGDPAAWSGAYETHGDVEVVRSAPGTTASTLEGCPEDADVVRGVYEGGLKAWECASDLAAHVGTAAFDCEKLLRDAGGRARVLELGAGQAGPGLAAARRLGARCETLTLTDYNRDVVEEVTAPNALATFALMEREGEAPPGRLRLLCGDWSGYDAFVEADGVDLLLTSESIYDAAQYGSLCAFIAHALSPRGVCLVAAKSYYFGVGGGTNAFASYCETYFGALRVERVKTISDGKSNVREILAIRKISEQ